MEKQRQIRSQLENKDKYRERVRFKVKGGKVEDGWRPQMHEMQIRSKIQKSKTKKTAFSGSV